MSTESLGLDSGMEPSPDISNLGYAATFSPGGTLPITDPLSSPQFMEDFSAGDVENGMQEDLLFQNQSTADAEVFVAIDQSLESTYSDWNQLKERTAEAFFDDSSFQQQSQQHTLDGASSQQPQQGAFTTAMTIASTDSNPSSEDEWTHEAKQRFDVVGLLAPMPRDTNAWDTVEGSMPPAIDTITSPLSYNFYGEQSAAAPAAASSLSDISSPADPSVKSVSHPSTPMEYSSGSSGVSHWNSDETAVGGVPNEASLPAKPRLTKDVLNAAAAAGLTRGQLVSKLACNACRKLKVSCGNERPCTRCVKFCRECVDRSEEEVEQSKERRKRRRKVPNGTDAADGHEETAAEEKVNSATSKPRGRTARQRALHPAALLPSTPAVHHSPTSLLSSQLYSRSFLVVLQSLGIREALMRLWGVMYSLPALSSLVQFRDQSTIMAMYLSDLLGVEDFELFMKAGLSKEEEESNVYQTCPLTRWIDVRQRPMHYLIQRGTDLPPSRFADASFTDSPHPQLLFAWTPQAISSFTMWRRLEKAKEEFDRQLREAKLKSERVVYGSDGDIPMTPSSNGVDSSLFRPVNLNNLSSRERAILGLPTSPHAVLPEDVVLALPTEKVENMTAYERARYLARLADRCGSTSRPVPDEDEAVAALVDSMNCLAVGPLDEEQFGGRGGGAEAQEKVQLGHAKWCLCERGAPSFGAKKSGGKCAKHPRKDGAHCVHDHSSVASSVDGASTSTAAAAAASSVSCTCERSLPLPIRVHTNAAFTRLFGYTEAEVQQGMYEDNMQFLRHLYPPSVWPAVQMTAATQLLGFANAIRVAAAKATGRACSGNGGGNGASTPAPSAPSSAAVSSAAASSAASPPLGRSSLHLMHTQIVTRSGAIFPTLVTKRTLPGVETMVQGHILTWEVKSLQSSHLHHGVVVPNPRE